MNLIPAYGSRRRARFVRRSTAAWSLLGAALLPQQAQAQDLRPQAEGRPNLDEDVIIVTARRRDEDVQSVPASITAIGENTLKQFQVQDLENIQSLDPSFSVSASSGRPNAPVYSLRGIRPTESVYGQDPTVAIYLADVVLSPAQGSNLGFYDLQNIQVLKGPQGTLFGRNTIGGAVLLTPRKPGSDFGVDAMAGAGKFGLFESELGVDIPLAETFHVRLAGRLIDGGNYQTNVAPGPNFGTKLGGQKTHSLRATIVSDLTPDITNTLIVSYDRKKTPGRGTILQAVNPANPINILYPQIRNAVVRAQNRPVTDIESDLRQKDNVEAWSVIDTFQASLSDDVTAKVIASYRGVRTDLVFDLDSSAVAKVLTSEQNAALDHASVEAQLLGTAFDRRLDWVAGLYWYNETGFENSPGDFFGGRIGQYGEVDNQSYSAFAQGSFHITPKLTLTVGGRLNRDKKRLELRSTFNGTICTLQVANPTGGLSRLPIGACVVNLSDTFSQPTGTVSLDYKVSPDTLLYLASRLGYRSGGFNLRASQPVQYEPFKAETVKDIEGGIKADWTIGDIRMRSDIAVFYQKYDDIQRTVAINTSVGTPATAVVNAASANVFGVELQQTIRPIDKLMLKINYVFNIPKYQDYIDPATNTDLSSTPFFFTPKHSGSAMVTYDQPVSADSQLIFGFNAAYTGKTWIDALHTSAVIAQHPTAIRPLLRQQGYWLLDANLTWQNMLGSHADLTLYAKNLTRTEYKIGGVQLYTGAPGLITAAYGEPRTFGAQLRFHY